MKFIKIILIIISFFVLESFKKKYNLKKATASCYWMENYSGKFNWVSVKEELGYDYTEEECLEIDDCDNGGACYKWAETANGPNLE